MGSILRSLYALVRWLPEKRRHLTPSIVLMVLSNLISLSIPLMAMEVIDRLKGTRTLDFGSFCLTVAGWLLALVVVAALNYFEEKWLRRYGNWVLGKMFSRMIEYHQGQYYQFWAGRNSKEIAAQINNDLAAMNPIVSGAFILVLRHAVIGVVSAALLLVINWKLTLAVSLLIPAFLVNYMLWGDRIRRSYEHSRRSNERYTGQLVEFLQSVPLMRIFGVSASEVDRVRDIFDGSLGTKFSYLVLTSKRQVYSRILASAAPLYVAFTGFYFLYFSLVTVGQVFAFWGIFAMLIGVVRGGSNLYSTFLEGTTVYNRIRPILDSEAIVPREQNATYCIETIECDRLEFSYDGDRRTKIVVPPFSLKKGEWIEISGDSGAGKTTLVRMILGELESEKGVVRVNGNPVREAALQGYLTHVGYVEQDGYIFSRSLRENILLGRKLDDSVWEKTIRTARLDAFIESLEDGPDQLLGENGVQMSGGERQRILIARAMYHQPQWLIFDEPFTGIDPENQEEIRKVIESLRGKTTVVLITHQKIPSLKFDQEIALPSRANNGPMNVQ